MLLKMIGVRLPGQNGDQAAETCTRDIPVLKMSSVVADMWGLSLTTCFRILLSDSQTREWISGSVEGL